MRYWDTSALIALFVEERSSSYFRGLVRDDPKLTTWTMTRVELVSALARMWRAEILGENAFRETVDRLDDAWPRWGEVRRHDAVRDRAERLLLHHALTSADALQLGAAFVAFDERPRGRGFVVVDANLARAADAEGFTVFTPPTARRRRR